MNERAVCGASATASPRLARVQEVRRAWAEGDGRQLEMRNALLPLVLLLRGACSHECECKRCDDESEAAASLNEGVVRAQRPCRCIAPSPQSVAGLAESRECEEAWRGVAWSVQAAGVEQEQSAMGARAVRACREGPRLRLTLTSRTFAETKDLKTSDERAPVSERAQIDPLVTVSCMLIASDRTAGGR